MGSVVQPNTFNMFLNSKIFSQMKQNACKENERTQMLVSLVEEVLHDQAMDEDLNESLNDSRSSNSIWNKTQFSKVL
jgi:hypothetical protein